MHTIWEREGLSPYSSEVFNGLIENSCIARGYGFCSIVEPAGTVITNCPTPAPPGV